LDAVKSEMGLFLKDIKKHLPEAMEITEAMEKDIIFRVTAAVEPLRKHFIVTQGRINVLVYICT
jgi:hypothetical protein